MNKTALKLMAAQLKAAGSMLISFAEILEKELK